MFLVLGFLIASPALAAISDTPLTQRIDHFVQAHQRAERAMAEFDRELDQMLKSGDGSNPLRRSNSYRQLLALRELKENDAEAIGEELESIQANNPAQAEKTIRAMQAKLAALPNSDRSAAKALLENISGHEASLAGLVEEKFSAFLQSKLIFPTGESKPAVKLQLMPSLIDLEMAEITSDMDFSDPEPQTASGLDFDAAVARKSAKIRPGTGPEGNMIGTNFPLNTWALTFDDGPHPTYTKQVVDTVRAHGHKVSFFWLARNVSGNKDAVAYARSAGMSLNNHSYTHADLSKASGDKLDREILDSTALETRLYGSRPEFFRTPYGAGRNSLAVRQRIADENMIHVFWNVDSLDWQDKNAESVFARVKKQMQLAKRGIILFHDIHPQSLAATKILMDYSDSLENTKQEIRWVTMPQIRDELNRN